MHDDGNHQVTDGKHPTTEHKDKNRNGVLGFLVGLVRIRLHGASLQLREKGKGGRGNIDGLFLAFLPVDKCLLFWAEKHTPSRVSALFAAASKST